MEYKPHPIVAEALAVLRPQLDTLRVTGSDMVRDYLRLRMHGKDREEFGVLFLATNHRLIEDVILFRGGPSACTCSPYTIAREALLRNAQAVLLYHNHPSGETEPSAADIRLTQQVRMGLELLDIRLLDHCIVGDTVTSMAEKGLL